MAPRLMILGGVHALTHQVTTVVAQEVERFERGAPFIVFPGDFRVAQLLDGVWVEIFPTIGEEPDDLPKRVRFLTPSPITPVEADLASQG